VISLQNLGNGKVTRSRESGAALEEGGGRWGKGIELSSGKEVYEGEKIHYPIRHTNNVKKEDPAENQRKETMQFSQLVVNREKI